MHKNVLKLVVIIALLLVAKLQAKEIKSLDHVGGYVFSLLKTYQNEDYNTFRKNLVTKQEALKFIKGEVKQLSVDNPSKDTLTTDEKNKFTDDFFSNAELRFKSYFEIFQEQSQKNQIDWESIVFDKFTNEENERFGQGKAYSGKLYFSSKQRKFTLETLVIKFNDSYHLWAIRRLKAVPNKSLEDKKL